MPDLEDLVRDTLLRQQALAPPARDLLAGAHAKRRHARTVLAVAGAVLATALAALASVAVISFGDSSTSGPASPPAPSPTPTRSLDRGESDDPMFYVAAPLLETPIGPPPIRQRQCTPSEISATAHLRHSAYGVVGVVQLDGDHCSIPIYPGPTALVDAHGRPLNVPVAPNSALTGQNSRPDLAFAAGHGAWGFAWTGSWCGPAPAGIVLSLTRDAPSPVAAKLSITVPITGPSPECSGRSDSTLVRGAPGAVGDSVLPPPADWSALTATLHIPDHPPYGANLTVTLANHSDHDIALDPCPSYALALDNEYRDGSYTSTDDGLLPCDATSTVPARRSVNFPLKRTSFNDDDNRTPISRTLKFAIAGGATASAAVP